MRRVVQFSCGAASAVAAKMVCMEDANAVVVNAFIKEEHDDNRRFLVDVERWIGRQITVLRDEKYGGSAYEVFRRNRFIKSRAGASCSRILKRQQLGSFNQPGDIPVLGFTIEEQERADDYLEANNGLGEFPLIQAGLSKGDCLAIVERAGIELPFMYRAGYSNANCIGCVKGGMGYWNRIRRDFPEHFEAMARIEEDIGPSAYLFRDRDTGERYPLRQLDPTAGRHDEVVPECGFACDAVSGRIEQARKENA